jgi:hypothetical protein
MLSFAFSFVGTNGAVFPGATETSNSNRTYFVPVMVETPGIAPGSCSLASSTFSAIAAEAAQSLCHEMAIAARF